MSFRTELDLAGRRVLVCGAGPDAMGPVRSLLDAGAVVRVLGTEPADTILDLAQRRLLVLERRSPTPADVATARLVVVAEPALNHAVRGWCHDAGIPVTAGRPSPADGQDRQAETEASRVGSVALVGGGPGDPGLITVAGLDAIRTAEVVVTDRLAPLSVLDQAPPHALILDVAKIPRGAFTPQERINEVLIRHARAGRRVVRLKGGDSFVFGRGGEEWQACAAAGIAVRVIPGVSSALAAPALAGIPVTHRQLTQGFTVVSGHLPPGHVGSTLNWAALARAHTTLVILMGVATLPAITAELIAQGLPRETPAVSVADAGLPRQRSVRGTVADIAERAAAAEVVAPAVTVIGAVAGFSTTVFSGDVDRGDSRSAT